MYFGYFDGHFTIYRGSLRAITTYEDDIKNKLSPFSVPCQEDAYYPIKISSTSKPVTRSVKLKKTGSKPSSRNPTPRQSRAPTPSGLVCEKLPHLFSLLRSNDVTELGSVREEFLVSNCITQPCPFRDNPIPTPIDNPDFEPCDNKNILQAGNKNSPRYICTHQDQHALYEATTTDVHSNRNNEWTNCTLQPCPHRLNSSIDQPEGFSQTNEDNYQLVKNKGNPPLSPIKEVHSKSPERTEPTKPDTDDEDEESDDPETDNPETDQAEHQTAPESNPTEQTQTAPESNPTEQTQTAPESNPTEQTHTPNEPTTSTIPERPITPEEPCKEKRHLLAKKLSEDAWFEEGARKGYCRLQPCPNRTNTYDSLNEASQKNFEICTPQNAPHAGNRSHPSYLCRNTDVHLFDSEELLDCHQGRDEDFYDCSIQPCPKRLFSAKTDYNSRFITTHLNQKEDILDNMSAKEIQINKTSEFDGDRSRYASWKNEWTLYLDINSKIYDTDVKKIGYILSYMTKGEAELWRNQWTREKTTTTGTNYGTFATFCTDLEKAFAEVYDEPVARVKLFQLKQKGMSAIDYTTRFKLLAAQGNLKTSGVAGATDDILLRDIYKAGLNKPLRDQVENEQNAPDTLADWIIRAIARDQQWRLNNVKTISLTPGTKTEVRKISLPRNPTTTIAKLTDAERERLRREGRCFFCREQGHMSRDCPKPKPPYSRPNQGSTNQVYIPPQNRTNQPPPYIKKEEPKTWEPKKFNAYIRQILNTMPDDEFDTFHQVWTESPFERSTHGSTSSSSQDFSSGD
ncbi:hypothetical protein EST38_g13822 [Candolleomyces aberdarensis]|uniref:CCHC-type domain-containing protein n=1 Tax=Candolleomyces aberdarensis TaxID=2316362 RepID=A0A4Q2D1N4_9AGAR|nr:hypothetical protein EST38_g13822 [Candolleomyces aberdarensis]